MARSDPESSIVRRRVRTNSKGGDVVMEGNAPVPKTGSASESGWAKQTHPDHNAIKVEEAMLRASYLADRESLAPFIIPHRFEGTADKTSDNKPTSLSLRKRLGYGSGLNKSYLSDIFGQLRAAPASYLWGKLGGNDAATGDTEPKPGTIARKMWNDATRQGKSWRNFFEGDVLEWLLTSLGGFIIVDAPNNPVESQGAEDRTNKRPFVRFVPWSMCEDWGFGDTGLRYLKIAESKDVRDPRKKNSEQANGMQALHLLYELTDTGTVISRVDDDDNPVGEKRELGDFLDMDGNKCLPIVRAAFGTHPRIAGVGTGLLHGLADIVIDLFNLRSERRSEFRDIAFSFLKYKGNRGDDVRKEFEQGQRFVDLGAEENADIDTVAASATGVDAGKQLYDEALNDWALAAKRNAQDAVAGPSAPRSGVSLQAEFELDSKPLLVRLAEELDSIETNVMFIAAQFAGETNLDADKLKVTRSTEFRLEDEAARISRIVKDAKDAGLPLAAEVMTRKAMDWNRATGIDLEQDVEVLGIDGKATGKRKLGDLVEEQTRAIANAGQKAAEREGEFGGFTLPPLADPNAGGAQ